MGSLAGDGMLLWLCWNVLEMNLLGPRNRGQELSQGIRDTRLCALVCVCVCVHMLNSFYNLAHRFHGWGALLCVSVL